MTRIRCVFLLVIASVQFYKKKIKILMPFFVDCPQFFEELCKQEEFTSISHFSI